MIRNRLLNREKRKGGYIFFSFATSPHLRSVIFNAHSAELALCCFCNLVSARGAHRHRTGSISSPNIDCTNCTLLIMCWKNSEWQCAFLCQDGKCSVNRAHESRLLDTLLDLWVIFSFIHPFLMLSCFESCFMTKHWLLAPCRQRPIKMCSGKKNATLHVFSDKTSRGMTTNYPSFSSVRL